MHAVISTMTLSQPLDEDILQRMQDELMSEAHAVPGFRQAHFVSLSEDTAVLMIICDSAESVLLLNDRLGSPWIGANLKPYVASTDRQVGPVLASSTS